MPQSLGHAHDSHAPGPQSFSQPFQVIGLRHETQQLPQHSLPQPLQPPQVESHVGPQTGPHDLHAPPPHDMQQQPEAYESKPQRATTNQRADMAKVPGGRARNNIRPSLSAGKVGPIEKIGLAGKFCQW
jgi:hypothetical protein